MAEVWKDVPGYTGEYQVSNLGRVRSLERTVRCSNGYRLVKGKILKQHIRDQGGHLGCSLGHKCHNIGVHRIVALAFIGEVPEGMEVLHINGDPTDNRPENLRYGTQTENILDVYYQGKAWRKLSLDDVQAIRFGICAGHTQEELAAEFGVQPDTIRDIRLGRRYAWLK